YEGLSYRRRRELHALVGEAYERRYAHDAGDYAELLSLHFFQAQTWEKAYRYSLLAGERAQEKFANVEAALFYRRALDVSQHLDLEADVVSGLWESLGDVCELAGRFGEAAEAYQRARETLPSDRSGEPMLMLKEGIIRE